MRTITAALTVAVLFTSAPHLVRAEDRKAEDSKTEGPRHLLCWKATRDGATVHLLGSVHVAKPAMYPLDKAIYEAFRQASALAVELDITKIDQAKMGLLIQQKGMLPAGQTLGDQLQPETEKALKAFVKKRKFPYGMLESMRPWLAIMMLEVQEYRRLGYREDLGIDKHFLERAAVAKKEIIALETLDDQFAALSSGSKEVQDLAVRSTIEQFDETGETMRKLVHYWKTGDAEKLEALIMEPLREYPKLRPWIEALFDKRNVGMANKVAKLASAEKPLFVVVGAGHLLGDKGMVKLLENKGFKVERVRPAKTAAVGK